MEDGVLSNDLYMRRAIHLIYSQLEDYHLLSVIYSIEAYRCREGEVESRPVKTIDTIVL